MPSKIPPAAVAAVACFAVVGLAGAAALMPRDANSSMAFEGPGVSIAVVDPREPVPEPGSVMDVGELTDGYQHRPYVRRVEYSRPIEEEFEDYDPGYDQPARVERAHVTVHEPAPPPVIMHREEPRRFSFGFDQPGPDYAAARRERLARMEERRGMEQERMSYRSEGPRRDSYSDGYREMPRRDESRRVYRSDGARLTTAETFY